MDGESSHKIDIFHYIANVIAQFSSHKKLLMVTDTLNVRLSKSTAIL